MAQVTAHPNVLAVVGVVTVGTPLMLLIPLCEHGSLLSLLRRAESDNSPGLTITRSDKRQFSADVAASASSRTGGRRAWLLCLSKRTSFFEPCAP